MADNTNCLGRSVPSELDGRPLRPYAGAFAALPVATPARGLGARMRRNPGRGAPVKLVRSWDELLDRLELRNGMTISFHHHLRDGDAVVNETIGRIVARGFGDLVIAPTALFPVHDRLVAHIESGAIARVEGSMNGAVGEACSRGAMRGVSVLRSHGGRCRAIESGELRVDLAVIAAPAADPFGNANGVQGRSACGPLGYALPDSVHAEQVVVVTDNLAREAASSMISIALSGRKRPEM